MNLADDIKQKAIDLGFDLVGIADGSPIDRADVERLAAWVDAGCAGQMQYMHQNLDKRTDPGKLLEGAQSVIVVGVNYKPAPSLPVNHPSHLIGHVAPYAQYEDYHRFIKKLLRKLTDFLISATGPGLKFKICTDSAPILERALAVRAGLGFIGRNHALINPKLGPQIFLGEIITNLELAADRPIDARCPKCDKCLSACPTGGLRPDGRFDSTKCISYLTIEYDGDIPADLAEKIGNHLFGCSECLLACPYQQNAPSRRNGEFTYYADRAGLDLDEILALTEDEYETRFAGSPLLRAGLARLKRNAQICLKNLSNSRAK
jgi:epoxyqueuosine reductase